MRHIGAVVGLIAFVGAVGNVIGDEVIVPANCQIIGEAEIISFDFSSREFALGDISGTSTSAAGVWDHVTPTTTWSLVPDNVTCRINGMEIGDSRGAIAGTSLSYVLYVEDRLPSLKFFAVDIVASRNAGRGPVQWEDGLLEGQVFLTIPGELPVIGGSAGNQWATLSFTLAEDGTEISCRYRGTGATPLEASDRYVLNACSGAGRFIEVGDEIEVELVELHLNGGSPRGRTTVSFPARIGDSVSDFYLFAVEDEARTELFRFAGWVDPDTGDFDVESLD
jgi:hypothetical protein